jgi:hypothetical protein
MPDIPSKHGPRHGMTKSIWTSLTYPSAGAAASRSSTWSGKGFATSAEFRAALLTGVRAIREHHAIGYVSDARKARVFVPEDQKGAMTDWPRKQWPRVLSESRW